MPQTLGSNIGYKGGSPRIQHEVLKPQPKTYGESDINNYITKIEKNYLMHNLSKDNLIYINNYLTALKQNQNYTENFPSKLVCDFIMIVETLYVDNKIKSNYIQSILNKLTNIIDNVTPPKIIKKEIKVEGEVNTINKYDGSILNTTNTKKPLVPLEKKVSTLDLNSIIKVIKTYYLEEIITKEQIENLNNSFKVLNGDSIELFNLPNFLEKINILVENAYTDGRMSQNKLLSLINELEIILSSEKPIKIKPKKVIKNHITNLAPGYKK